jgi:hypothetical protein
VNPEPGQLSNLQKGYLRGPFFIGLDMNVVKRIQISETKNVELRVDAINVLNHPNWGNPNTSINLHFSRQERRLDFQPRSGDRM